MLRRGFSRRLRAVPTRGRDVFGKTGYRRHCEQSEATRKPLISLETAKDLAIITMTKPNENSDLFSAEQIAEAIHFILADWANLRARLFELGPDEWDRKTLVARILHRLCDKSVSREESRRKRAS